MPRSSITGKVTEMAHGHPSYEPARAVEWLMDKLGFITEFEQSVNDPYAYGE
jgi:hypothetical protein